MLKNVFSICGLLFCFSLSSYGQTPVEQFGQIAIDSNKIIDGEGNPVQLRGMSMFWSQWGSKYYKRSTIDWLVEDWKITVIRAAMGVDTVAGYLGSETRAAQNKALVDTIVEAAIANGIYVVIDWHDHEAYKHIDSAKTFFQDMATRYGEYPNVIYEIFNEPLKVSWSDTVKPYADTIISAIRAIDEDNIIIVGTPQWCQNVDVASLDPITRYDNISYAFHFYAATHKLPFRNKATIALNNGISLFVSEWGTCASSGSGILDLTETKNWLQFMDLNKLSWCNWSVNSKAETASVLRTTASSSGNWTEEDLTPSGILLRSILRSYAGVEDLDSTIFIKKFDTIPVPGRVEAELYKNSGNIQTESTTDVGKGYNIGYIDNNDWADYIINVIDTGTFNMDIRVASATEGGTMLLALNNKTFDTVSVAGTGGWQIWNTIHSSISLPDTGIHFLKISFRGVDTIGLFNVNWLDINSSSPVISPLRGAYKKLRMVQTRQGLRIDIPSQAKIKKVEIYNNSGRRINSYNLPIGSSSLNTGELRAGSYIVRLIGDNVLSRPFVVVK